MCHIRRIIYNIYSFTYSCEAFSCVFAHPHPYPYKDTWKTWLRMDVLNKSVPYNVARLHYPHNLVVRCCLFNLEVKVIKVIKHPPCDIFPKAQTFLMKIFYLKHSFLVVAFQYTYYLLVRLCKSFCSLSLLLHPLAYFVSFFVSYHYQHLFFLDDVLWDLFSKCLLIF